MVVVYDVIGCWEVLFVIVVVGMVFVVFGVWLVGWWIVEDDFVGWWCGMGDGFDNGLDGWLWFVILEW